MAWFRFPQPNGLLLLFSFLLMSGLGGGSSVLAGISESARGWMWGGSEENDVNGATPPNNGSVDGNENPLGWASVNNVTSGGLISYGVNIPVSGGTVTGYAWSETIGWIRFDPVNDGSMPPGCTGGVFLSGNDFFGCARVISIEEARSIGNSGGWDGWIKMRGANYGVGISGINLSGYAWSSELGWIDFTRVTVMASPFVRICPDVDQAMAVGQTRGVRAYHFPSGIGSCADLFVAIDVTADPQTVWSVSSVTPGPVSVSLSYDAGSGNEMITAVSLGVSRVTATYMTLPSHSIEVTVIDIPCMCSCDDAENATYPFGRAYIRTCFPGCSVSCVGTRKDYFREVEP